MANYKPYGQASVQDVSNYNQSQKGSPILSCKKEAKQRITGKKTGWNSQYSQRGTGHSKRRLQPVQDHAEEEGRHQGANTVYQQYLPTKQAQFI
jgi:hypothetical protein